jgi:hypothetical protein
MFKIGISTSNYYTVIISYNLVTQVTLVIVLGQTRKDGSDAIKSWFGHLSDWHLEPFAIIRILVDGVLSMSASNVETMDLRLGVLQSRMGQHTYRGRQRGDPLKMDFTWATRVLNHASTILAMNKLRVRGAQNVLKKAEEFQAMITAKREGNGKDGEAILSDNDQNGCILTELMEALDDRCGNLLDRIEYEQQRVQTQLAAVSPNSM